MYADTIELFRKYMGEKNFQRLKYYDTLSEMWEACSKEYADLTAVEDDGKAYTYRQLAGDVAKFRTVLKNNGAERGQRIGILLPNSYELVKAYLAAATLGCTAVILPAHLDEKQTFGTKMMFGFTILVTASPEKAAIIKSKMPDFPVISGEESADDTTDAVFGEGSDGAVIIMTGGTTGKPKGALLSNTAVLAGTVNSCLGCKYVYEQRYLLVLPMSHVFGLIRNVMASLYTGSTLFICRDNRNMFRDAAAFRPTVMILVPALADMALTLSKKFGRNMFGPDLKTIICGAANVPPYLIEEYNRMGVELLPGYGLTESANLVSGNPENLSKPSSVGIIYPGMEYRIENGELWLKGKNMMDGYVGCEEQGAYEDGWFRTGDLVKLDEEGFLYITGRIKEIIVLPTGENISPAEVEAKFNELSFIQDSQVFEDKDDSDRRFLALEVVPRETELAKIEAPDKNAYIVEALHKVNESLPSFQRVSRIEIRTSDFERTPSMKIVRYKKCQ